MTGVHPDWLEQLEEHLVSGRPIPDGVRSHARACEPCRDASRAMAGAAEHLRATATVLPIEEPPAGLRERVMRRVSQEAAIELVPQAAAPRRRRPVLAISGALAAAALAAALVGLGTRLEPASSAFLMHGTDAAPLVEGVVRIEAAAGGSVAMDLEVAGLPASNPGEFYEVWWVGPGNRHVSCGSFRSDGSTLRLSMTSGVDQEETVKIEITLEQDDGDPGVGQHLAST